MAENDTAKHYSEIGSKMW